MIEHIEPGILPPNKKACIALTSWKKRINTVGLTIFNLVTTCGPDYHIVLTLAEEEFPRKERELPRDLVLMNRVGLFEILWVKKNWKSFKKWIFTGLKYSSVPIITADDDVIYTCDYASGLFDSYMHNKKHKIITWINSINSGQGILIEPSNICSRLVSKLNNMPLLSIDSCMCAYITKYRIDTLSLKRERCTIQHTNVAPINMAQYNNLEQYKIIQLYQSKV